MQGRVLSTTTLAVLAALAFASCSTTEPAQALHPAAEADSGADATLDARRRTIPADVLARRAVAYSGYRAGQSPDVQAYPSEAQIQEDLELLVRGGWGF